MKKILSIDGGGIHGIIPAIVLTEIEKRTEKPIAALFDLLAGTSAGGIIALGLVKPDSDGKPQYKAKDLAKLYEEDGHIIFNESLWRKIYTVNNLFEEKYMSQGIDSVLSRYFGNAYLKDVVTDVLIPSYEIEKRDAFFFKSTHAKKKKNYNFLLRQIARATSAAPTFFEPEKIYTEDKSEHFFLVDGGVFANNPGMCAYVEAKTMFPDEKDFLVVSLGTGSRTLPISYDRAKHWGIAQWAQPILSVVFDGVGDTVDYELQQLLPTMEKKGQQYYRFQVTLDKATDPMDNANPQNIQTLKHYAEMIIKEQNNIITTLCQQLVKHE